MIEIWDAPLSTLSCGFAICARDLALQVSTIVGDALVRPDLDIEESPGDHGRVQGVHLPPDVSLELIKVGGPRAVDTGLEEPPQEEVEWVQIRTPRGPVSSSATSSGHDPAIELVLEIGNVGVRDVARSAVLLPRQGRATGKMRCYF